MERIIFFSFDDQSGEENNFLIRARLDPGTYYIEVRVSGIETGNYVIHVDVVVDDHSDTIAMATELTLNTSVSGTIDSGNDVDYFSIDISTPTFVAIFTTGNLDTVGTLYNGTNTFLQSDDNSGGYPNFLIRDRLDPGTYYIQVASFGTGNYVLHVDVVTTTEIELNTSISGTIDPGNDVDYFSIDISTPTFVVIFTIGNLDTRGTLLDRTNTFLQSDDNSGGYPNFLIRDRLDPGTYYIQVGSFGTGNYVLHIDVVVDDHSDTIAMATELTLNTSVSGTIDSGNDVDYFSLVISTPTFVIIFTTGNLDTVGSLIDSVGNVLQIDYYSGAENNFLIRDRLDPETYYIQVASFGTGNYVLHVDVVTVTEIELNTSISGTIDPGNDVDYFSIDISTPTFVVIFTIGNLDTRGTLLDRTNTFLQSDDNSGGYPNFLIRDHLDPGTYYIQVASFGTGNYVLHIDVVVDDHSDTIAMATELTLNTSVSGTIDSGNDVDYFSLVISTPTFVVIFTTGNLDTVGSLIDSVGNVLQIDYYSGAENNFLIRDRLDPETYYIQVASFGTGNYVLHVDVVTVTEIELNTSISGTIDPGNDVDYFSIDISAPTFVAIYTIGNLDTVGTLYDGTNTFLQSDDNSGGYPNFLIFYRLDPGTYYIQVASFGTGNYVLHVDVVTTTEIELNTSVSGTIDPGMT